MKNYIVVRRMSGGKWMVELFEDNGQLLDSVVASSTGHARMVLNRWGYPLKNKIMWSQIQYSIERWFDLPNPEGA